MHYRLALRHALFALAAAAALAQTARGVITYSDPGRNTTAPADPTLNGLWQLEGQFRGFLGTPIAPHYFITAEHIGGSVGESFVFGGKIYATSAVYDDPNTDLRVWHVNGTLPSVAPIYTGSSETSLPLFIVGRGSQRGTAVQVGGVTRGWQWGAQDAVQSWGQNVVSGIANGGTGIGQALAFAFDGGTLGVANEATVSVGDSGGGVFVFDGTNWKLAGITYGVNAGPFSTTGDPHDPGFTAAVFDQTGLYSGGTFNSATGTYAWDLVTDNGSPQPTYAFASRISSNLTFINNALATPEPTWSINASGNWSNASNWTGGVPSGADAAANLGSAINSAHTVTLDAPFTVGTVNFNNASASYTIAGASTLTIAALNDPNGAINVLAGTHTISAPVQLNSNTTLNVAPANGSLTISGPLTISPSVTVTKSGAGAVQVNSVRAASLSITGGTLKIATSGGSTAATSNVKLLTLAGATNAWAAKLDLTDNSLVVDYGLAGSPIATITNQLKSGYAGGAWTGNGITSSTAAANTGSAHKTALGVAEAADVFTSFPASFRGQSVNNTSVLIRYTASGDANLDGVVDTLDFNSLAANFGKSGQRWSRGDFNYDGVIDTLDFNSLAGNFGFAVTTTSSASELASVGTIVPEPSIIAASTFIAGALLMRRRSRK